MSPLVLLLSLLLGFLHEGSCVILVGEDMEPGTVLASYLCSSSHSIKTSGGISSDFFKFIQAGSSSNLTLARKVDLENETDFTISTTANCHREVHLSNVILTYTCDGSARTDSLVITGRDEFHPYFCTKNCSKIEDVALTVPENTTVGATILDFNICDKDVNAGSSSLAIQIKPNTYLKEANKNALKLQTSLDYESETKTFSSAASINGKRLLNISITVTDSDDLGVAFDKQVFKCFIPENHPQTVTNCSVVAKDLDKGLNTPVSYELISGTPYGKELFELLPNGSFSLKSPLDREKVAVYYLAVKGFQVDRPHDKINYTTVLLTVTDVDDNNPEMSRNNYNASVVENSPVGTTVCQVLATDKDEGENSNFEYKIVGDSAFFEVDGSTGSVKVKAPIDRESIMSNQVVFKVQAVSVKTPTKRSQRSNVTVHIYDENDNSPTFVQQINTVNINKTQALNTNIFQINATDTDKGQNGKVTYRIENTATPFHIDPSNGNVSLKQALNDTFDPIYSLVVVAHDNAVKPQDRRSSLMVVMVKVSDVNIHVPHFFSNLTTKVNIPEDAMIGTTVIELKATDKDPTDTLSYTIENGKGVFKIEDKYLKTNIALDREVTTAYNVVVVVNDSVHVTKKNVIVQVTDVNDNGPAFNNSQYIFDITEEKSFKSLGHVFATDLDDGLNGEVVYEIDVGSKWSRSFIVDKNGTLSTQGALDREAISPDEKVTFLVFAYDRGLPERMNSTIVTVNIKDVNDNGPAFDTKEKIVHYQFKEGSQPINFHEAKAFDPDGETYSDVFYRLKETTMQNVIDVTDKGNVSLGKVLNFSDANSCNGTCVKFTIEAYNKERYSQNAAGLSGTDGMQTVILDIKDINNNKPAFAKNQYIKQISECMEPGKEILRVSASDADTTAEFSTVFFWMEQSNDTFYVAPDTGSIYLTGNIDYDPPANQSQFAFNVYATDDLKYRDKSISTRVILNISACNDNPPVFQSGIYWCHIYENMKGNFNCTTVATDADGDTIKYSVALPQHAKEFTVSASTGSISAVAPFDFDTANPKEYTINISASDTKHTRFATVIVKVLDVNDERPTFEKNDYVFNIKENVKDASYFVGEVKVSDADSIFSLSIDNCFSQCKECFHIGEKGDIVALREFDYESSLPNRFTCVISANDSLTDIVKINVSINILDANDNTPTFSNSSVFSSINETATKGTIVRQLSASDKDRSQSLNEISYSVYGGNELNLFSINSANGSVFTNKELDDHFGENVTLVIRACDYGIPRLCGFSHLTIHINNLNIHKPVFIGTPYHVLLKEGNGNISVFQVHAEDRDGDRLQFKVVNETSTFFFQNNVLYANDLDAEMFRNTSGLCYVGIQVSDGMHTILTTLVVTIIDVNDNAPKLLAKSPKGYIVHVEDTARVGKSIYTIAVKDNDISNKGFTHFLHGGKGDFEINQTTGDVIVANTFGNHGKTYDMSIIVMDHGEPPKSDSSMIYVNVIDTFPSFHLDNFSLHMKEENATEQASLAVVGDNGSVNHIDYDIISENKNKILELFRLDHSTGLLTLANMSNHLNYEQQSIYEFILLAKDHGVFPKTAVTNVSINVVDVNEKPKLTCNEMVVIKEENSSAGSIISRVQANDPDTNEPFSKLLFTLSDSNTFDVDKSGNITVKANNLKAGNYSLAVTVTDGGFLNDTLTIEIVVPSINVTSFTLSLRENNSVPYLIRKLGTVINGMTIMYDIIQSSFSGLFLVTNNGSLILNDIVDRESTDSVVVHVNGRDISSGVLLTRITVIVHVVDINDCSPAFPLENYAVNIDDLIQTDTVIATIAAVDRDIDEENRNLTYKLTGTDGLFSMDRLGHLKVHNLSRLQTRTYNIVINVTDGRFQNKAHLKINVVDTNDHSPGFSKSVYRFNITETKHTGIVVGSVVSHDKDSGRNGNVTLSITAGNHDTAFKISGTSGLIESIKPLDREHFDKYQLIVTAKDNGKNPRQGTSTVIVNLLDINDNSPKLQAVSYTASVLENCKRRTNVIVSPEITATDADSGVNGLEGLVYKLNDTRSPFCIARVSSGASIYVCDDIDRELQETYYLEVIVLDSNGSGQSHHTSAPLTIRILDENDEVPQFTKSVYGFNVSENEHKSVSIGKVEATDNDINGDKGITYEIVKGDEGKFHIDTYSGVIYVEGSIDREKKSEFKLYVVAFDGINRNFTNVIIHVTDMNDNSPIFTMLVVDVVENRNGTVFNATVYDKDEMFTENSRVSFSAESRDSRGAKTSKFSIRKDGGLYLTSTLDREANDHYEVTITATDDGTPPLSSSLALYINVLDMNDNHPEVCVDGKCGIPDTDIHISANTPAMAVLKMLDSRDPDKGSNATVTFSLIQTPLSKYFNIEGKTGVLKIVEPKELLALAQSGNTHPNGLNVSVIATDGGLHVSNALTVHVRVDP